jgi:Holliday junction resolvase RusA-like endonuclease
MGKRRGFGGPDVALKLKAAAFYLERLKSHFKQNKIGNPLSSRAIPVSRARGDTDNFLKFIKDCMNGIMYKDDRQITNLGPSKKAYTAGPEAFQGRTIITISSDETAKQRPPS